MNGAELVIEIVRVPFERVFLLLTYMSITVRQLVPTVGNRT
jgi:hypothetical protein